MCAQQAFLNSLSPCPNSQGQTLREVSTFLWVSVSCEPSDAQSRARLVGQKGPFRPGSQEHLCSLSCAWAQKSLCGVEMPSRGQSVSARIVSLSKPRLAVHTQLIVRMDGGCDFCHLWN